MSKNINELENYKYYKNRHNIIKDRSEYCWYKW